MKRVDIFDRPFLRHNQHQRIIGARGIGLERDQSPALDHAAIFVIDNQSVAVKIRIIGDPYADFARDAGQRFKPLHHISHFEIGEMPQITLPLLLDDLIQAGLKPLGRFLGKGLTRENLTPTQSSRAAC